MTFETVATTFEYKHIAKEKPVPKGDRSDPFDRIDHPIYIPRKRANVEPFKGYDAALACDHDPKIPAIMAVRKLSSRAGLVSVESH